MILARKKIIKIPELYDFCPKINKIPEFYMIIARKIVFPNLGRGTCPLSPFYACDFYDRQEYIMQTIAKTKCVAI